MENEVYITHCDESVKILEYLVDGDPNSVFEKFGISPLQTFLSNGMAKQYITEEDFIFLKLILGVLDFESYSYQYHPFTRKAIPVYYVPALLWASVD